MDKDRYFSLIIIILVVIGVLSVVYILVNPQPSERFTEFYVLNEEGKAGNYPVNLTTGEVGKITLGVVNHEYQKTNYLLVVKLDNSTIYSEEFSLSDKEKKEIPLEFAAKSSGSQKLEMFLYKSPDTSNVYRYLFLQLNIS
ncbi:MAG: DUF1616 domain-containing protein [Methanobacteriaceae archaeon]|nr:DUF1616 domain-containing protein [Methanobacteriaceae archaeon]